MANAKRVRWGAILALIVIFFITLATQKNGAALSVHAAESDGQLIVVSMGDSYSSGEGIEPFYGQNDSIKNKVKNQDWLAHRSQYAWPGLLWFPGMEQNDFLFKHHCAVGDTCKDNISWYFVAASGATTDDIFDGMSKLVDLWDSSFHHYWDYYDVDPQIDVFKSIKGEVDYVTITIGGNDAHFSSIVTECIVGSSYLNPNKLSNKLDKVWDEYFYGSKDNPMSIHDRLIFTYQQISEAAGSQAKIIVAGYPKLLSDRAVTVSADEARQVNEAVEVFNIKISELVDFCRSKYGLNIYFASVEEKFNGHEAYSKDAYINKVSHNPKFVNKTQDLDHLELISAYSLHPNLKGAGAYARAVQQRIYEIEETPESERRDFSNISSFLKSLSPTVTPIPTNTPSPSPTETPTPTNIPTPEPTPTPTPEPTPTETPVPTPTETPIPTPTETPTPTPSPEPTSTPTPSFSEEGETKYGDLTKYLGMTAGEVIDLIGKPYQYQTMHSMETATTGGMWFDKDVMFAFCDSGDTLDMSCRIIEVWVQSTSESGIAKDLGNGIDATMNYDDLKKVFGAALTDYQEDGLQGGVSARVHIGDYWYDFYWECGTYKANYDVSTAPELISIYKPYVDESKGTGSTDELIRRYLHAYQTADFSEMISLIWPREFEAIQEYRSVDDEDCARILSYILIDKLEMDGLTVDSEAECSYSYEVIEERAVTYEDYSSILQVYRYALVKPERIAFLDAVYLIVNNKRYNLIGDDVIALCFNGRWYLPSAYTGIWGTTEEDFYSNTRFLDEFYVK